MSEEVVAVQNPEARKPTFLSYLILSSPALVFLMIACISFFVYDQTLYKSLWFAVMIIALTILIFLTCAFFLLDEENGKIVIKRRTGVRIAIMSVIWIGASFMLFYTGLTIWIAIIAPPLTMTILIIIYFAFKYQDYSEGMY